MAPSVSPLFARPTVVSETRSDGSVLVHPTQPLGAFDHTLGETFRTWAARAPERPLIGQRVGDGSWRTVSYRQARETADSLAQAYLDLGLGPDRPVLILSENSIEHLLLTLAGYTAGVPVVPVSVAYSLQSRDQARLRAVAEIVSPGLVYATDGDRFGNALRAVGGRGTEVAVDDAPASPHHLRFHELAATTATPAVDDAFASVGAGSVAKVLFTSGSTGVPKGVVNTHAMLCANQQMIRQAWPFLETAPPTLLDWLPWSHTFGGNHNVNMVLKNGGTLYIDDGKPTPALFDRTAAALDEVSPTVYFNVPAGYAMLAPYLETHPEAAARFFARLQLVFYAAAALPQELWKRLRMLSTTTLGHEIPVTTSWGATETSPAHTSAHHSYDRSDCIGVPLPGAEVKLVPSGDKQELRVKGPNVFSEYYKRPDLTAAAFDDEGYYRVGDAARLVDDSDPGQGLRFDGRVAEDFKLDTGTWVNVAAVRARLLSASAVLQDAVIAGENRSSVVALAWINPAEAARLVGVDGIDAAQACSRPALRSHLTDALAAMNRDLGSASRVERLLLLTEPADLDAGEITDKGYVNQRTVRTRRGGLIERLYGPASPAEAVVSDTALSEAPSAEPTADPT